MLTTPYIVQQFLAACIGNTEDETDPSVSDTEQRDEQQTELELAADDNSTNDAESEASDASDTPAPEPSEIENADEGSASEETPSEDEASPVAIDDDSSHTESNSEVLPISIDEEAHASEDDLPIHPGQKKPLSSRSPTSRRPMMKQLIHRKTPIPFLKIRRNLQRKL